jgi:hypothetical protein
MKLILEILPQNSHEEFALHRVVEKFPVTVGRGFHNDVIVTDPHISPQHIRIEEDGEGWMIRDLDSRNGVFINSVRQHDSLSVRSGDVIRVGHTYLRFYAPHHAVDDALPLHKPHPGFSWLSHRASAWIFFLLAVAVTQIWSFFEVWADEQGMIFAAAALGAVGTVVIWTALWSVAGSLIKKRPSFQGHAVMICLYLIACTLAFYIEAYTDFLTNENWLGDITSYGINFILLAFLLYGSLALATRMRRQRQLFAAMLVSFGIMGGIFGVNMVSDKNFNQQPVYPATLKPFPQQLIPADSTDEFMKGSEKLFTSSSEFEKQKSGS